MILLEKISLRILDSESQKERLISRVKGETMQYTSCTVRLYRTTTQKIHYTDHPDDERWSAQTTDEFWGSSSSQKHIKRHNKRRVKSSLKLSSLPWNVLVWQKAWEISLQFMHRQISPQEKGCSRRADEIESYVKNFVWETRQTQANTRHSDLSSEHTKLNHEHILWQSINVVMPKKEEKSSKEREIYNFFFFFSFFCWESSFCQNWKTFIRFKK